MLRSLLAILLISLLSDSLSGGKLIRKVSSDGNSVTEVGSRLLFGSNANSGTQAITIDAETEAIILFVGAYDGTGANYTSPDADPSIDSDAFTLIESEESASSAQGAIYVLLNPSTGSQTFSWDWQDADTMNDGANFALISVKDCDTTGGAAGVLRDSDSAVGGAPITSATVTAETGDLLLAVYVYQDIADDDTVDWTNATELTTITTGTHEMSLASNSPSGNQTVTGDTTPNTESFTGLFVAVIEHD